MFKIFKLRTELIVAQREEIKALNHLVECYRGESRASDKFINALKERIEELEGVSYEQGG